MKMGIIKSILAISALAAVTTSPVQAQTWVDSFGTGLPPGTPITVAGPLKISQFGWIGQKTCDISIDGMVTSSQTITFTHSTPGFISNCTSENEGEVELPITVYAEYYPFSPTGERVTSYSVVYHSPFGTCHFPTLSFNWYDATTSEAVLPVSASISTCTLHGGSKLRVTGSHSGNLSIN